MSIEKLLLNFENLYMYFHDYVVLYYHKFLGNGCNPVEKFDSCYCGISKHLHHKFLVKKLCVNGKPNEKMLVKKRLSGDPIYSYIGCTRKKEKEKLIN